MLPGHWLRGLSRSSETGAGERGKPAAEVRMEICAGAWGQTCCGMGAEAGVC